MVNTEKKSTILLLCLGLDTDKKEVKSLRAADLRKMFGSTGQLKRILIFTKQVLLKGFLEYGSFEEAANAVSAFHDKFIGKYGKARLYYSPLQKIDLSNKYLEFWDEKTDKSKDFHLEAESTDFSLVQESLTLSNDKENLVSYLEDSSSFYTKNWGNSENNSKLALTLNFNRENSRIFKGDHGEGLNQKNLRIFNMDMCEHSTRNSYSRISGKQPRVFGRKQQVKTNKYFNYNNFSKLKAKKNPNLISPSKVIIISNLGFVFRDSEELFNLLSCFGVVKGIIYMKNLQKALVEYTTVGSATECITNIDNLFLGPTKLKISYSRHSEIDFKRSRMDQTSLQYNEIVEIPDHQQRYEKGKKISPNPISPSVIVTAEWTSQVMPTDIYYYIEKYCKPKVVKMANQEEETDGQPKQIKLHLVFEDVNSAIYVIYKCHNKEVKDSRIGISFY